MIKVKVWRRRNKTTLTEFVSVLMVQVVRVFIREAIEIVSCPYSYNLDLKYELNTAYCWSLGSHGSDCVRAPFSRLVQ